MDKSTTDLRRRRILQAAGASLLLARTGAFADPSVNSLKAQLILRNGQFATMDRQNPQATAVAISDGRFIAAGNDDEVMRLANSNTQVIDLNRRCVIPGLIDSHLHSCVAFLPYVRISLKSLIHKDYDFEPKTIGEHILKRRLYLKLSQPKLAKLLDVSTETILNWELNYRKPCINHIGKLIQFLGYDPEFSNSNSIAELLLEKRRELGWTQKVAARNLGIDPSTWSSWECGGTIMMRDHRRMVALLLGVDEEKVFEDMKKQWNERHGK